MFINLYKLISYLKIKYLLIIKNKIKILSSKMKIKIKVKKKLFNLNVM